MTNTVLVEVPEVRSKALAKCLAQLQEGMFIKLELPLEIVFIIYCWLLKSQFWETIMTLQDEPGVVHDSCFFFNSCLITCFVVERLPSLLFCLIFFVGIKAIFVFYP